MQIILNGKTEEVADNASVAELVERQGLAGGACAVEVNKQIVTKKKHGDHRLQPGDVVEIVTLVGGG